MCNHSNSLQRSCLRGCLPAFWSRGHLSSCRITRWERVVAAVARRHAILPATRVPMQVQHQATEAHGTDKGVAFSLPSPATFAAFSLSASSTPLTSAPRCHLYLRHGQARDPPGVLLGCRLTRFRPLSAAKSDAVVSPKATMSPFAVAQSTATATRHHRPPAGSAVNWRPRCSNVSLVAVATGRPGASLANRLLQRRNG